MLPSSTSNNDDDMVIADPDDAIVVIQLHGCTDANVNTALENVLAKFLRISNSRISSSITKQEDICIAEITISQSECDGKGINEMITDLQDAVEDEFSDLDIRR